MRSRLVELWRSIRRWFVYTSIFVVAISLLLGGSYLAVTQFLPETQKQDLLQVTLTVSLAVVVANVVVSVMQWFGKSPLDFLPELTLQEKLKRQDRNRFILSRSKDIASLSAQVKASKDQASKDKNQYEWMYLFAEALVRQQPNNPDAYEHLGEALLKIGNFEYAIQAGNKLVQLEPLNHQGYCIIGDAYFEQANWEQSRIWYEKARECATQSQERFVLPDLIETYEKLGLVDEAINALNDLLPLLDDKTYYENKLQDFIYKKDKKTKIQR